MSTSGLSAVARWDVGALGNAVATLTAVGDRLVSWRARMEGVGRTLEATDCWSGPAGTEAAGSLRRVSSVVTETTAALARSLSEAELMVSAARYATDLAEQARATAAAVPVALDERGVPGPLPAVPLGSAPDPAQALAQQYSVVAEQAAAAARAAEEAVSALRWADVAALNADDALAALGGAGVVGGVAPVDFAGLTAGVERDGIAPPGDVPVTPPAVAAWWAGMSEEQRRGWIEGSPGLVGMLDGVPAWARDRANRLLLDSVTSSDPGFGVAVAVQNEIRAREEAGEVVQLYQFAPEHQLVALAMGDVDTADAVAFVVPGVGNDPLEELDDVSADAAAVADAAVAAAPGLAVAAVAWFGYRPPADLVDGAGTGAARLGATSLDRTLDGVAATRAPDPARVSVVAHSYGTVVTDLAADAPGVLAADDVVLLGSPGVDNDRAGFEVDEIYEASGALDPVTWAEFHGGQTWDPDTGLDAVSLPTDETTGHGDYFDPDLPTLPGIGEVVAGTSDG